MLLQACRDDPFEVPYMYLPPQTTPYEIQIPDSFPSLPPQDVELTVEGVTLGKKLFYDPILSADGTQSCASCHNQSLGFTDNGKRFSVGIDGKEGTKNAMPLFNLGYYTKFFWDGRSPNLMHQALQPVIDPLEMHNTWSNAIQKLQNHNEYPELFEKAYGNIPIDSTLVSHAITQFELSMISANSKYDKAIKFLVPFTLQEQLGMQIFNTEPRRKPTDPPGGDCFHCHGGPLFTDLMFNNNGLDDETTIAKGLEAVSGNSFDRGKFKTPSLRNIEVTGPYMHDGRFETLEQVVEHYNSGVKITPSLAPIMLKTDSLGDNQGIAGGLFLNNDEKAALVAFLKTLTDDQFLTNPEFAAPN